MKKTKEIRGITLVALVITIIILLILAAISIQALTNTGLLGKTNDAKIESKMSEIEEFATLKVYELYTENIYNMDAVNDATITTALKAELKTKGYETKDANTTSETVKGLKIQDSTGQNNFDSISLLQQKNTTIKVDLDITSQSKTYVKIYENWYELIINDKTVKVSREKYEGPVDSENTYAIKLTPPTSGIIMTAGGEPISSETEITPETLIVIQAGNSTGKFTFTVKETTSSVTRNVDINVTADPEYATDVSIAVYGGAKAEIIQGKTLQLVATKTPEDSTDTISWNIESGSATIDATGLVTANADATNESTIIAKASCVRADNTPSLVENTITITVKQEKTDGPKVKIDGTEVTLTKENFGDYLGKQVTNYTGQSSVTIGSSTYIVSPTYRLYYVDFDEKYGDEVGTIYLKAECTTNNYALPTTDTSLATADGIKIDELNPSLYASGVTSPNASKKNMKAVTWLTNTTNWASLADTTHSSMSSKIKYIVGSPSLEMMMDSYNAHYGLTGKSPYTGSLSVTSDRVKLFYKYTSGESGYRVGPSNSSSASNGYYMKTSRYSVKTDSSIDTMYYPGSGNYYWLASPAGFTSGNVKFVSA